MKEFRSILVTIDGSKNSNRALERAIYMAGLCQAKIGLLHVINLGAKISSFEQVTVGGYIPDNIKEEGREILNAANKLVPQTLRTEVFIEIGAPMEVIVEFCQTNNYDLIIMGSRGHGPIKQFLLGSVSHYVLNHAPCPVLVVR